MKAILFLLLIFLFSCAPYKRLPEPVKMNHAVNLNENGTILCRDVAVYKDSLVLIDAGYFSNRIHQRFVADVTFVNWPSVMIVHLK